MEHPQTIIASMLMLATSALSSCSSQDGKVGKMDASTDDTDPKDGGHSSGCTKLDILFVVDDSGSMACEQEMLVAAFPQFVDILEQYSNDATDAVSYRIGVTSTGRRVDWTLDMPDPTPDYTETKDGMNGELNWADASVPWVEGPGDKAAIVQELGKRALLGTDGPSYEMPLECMRLAVDKSAPGMANEGFLRQNALFIAVVITDEDDCSRVDETFTATNDRCTLAPQEHNLYPLQEYTQFLDGRFGDSKRWVFVSVAGLGGCSTETWADECPPDDNQAGALDATRLRSFVDDHVNTAGSTNGLFSDICTVPVADALEDALNKMQVACDEFIIE